MIKTGQNVGPPRKPVNSSGSFLRGLVFCCFLFLFAELFISAVSVTAAEDTFQITVNYSGAIDFQTITVDFCDDWLLQPDDQYNHKLAQASFAMTVTGFRSKIYDISEKDHDILDFFEKAGFIEPRSDDYNKEPGINTIADVIAHKKAGDDTIIAVSISGNNYQNEWLSNFTIDNNLRPAGFESAAEKVMGRIEDYIEDCHLSGDLRLWVSGYSRAAAVANILAADAVETHKFQSVYAYTFATPRTTREDDPDRYHNIFNIIDPEDVVPLIPFPEWGYERYGKDLFVPAISTDSLYNEKYIDAFTAGTFTADMEEPIFNPRIRRVLHTIFDYLAFFVNSPETYMNSLQNILIEFYENRNISGLIKRSAERINVRGILNSYRERREKFLFNLNEYYNFIDFLAHNIFNDYVANEFDQTKDYYWNRDISILENVAFGHLEKTYRSWLFSSDDPSRIFVEEPKYFHYTIWGDVDVEIFDEYGNLIEQFDHSGEFEFDGETVRWPDFQGDLSNILIYAEREGEQTLLEFPADRIYMIYIYSIKDQDIRVSSVEYSSEKLMADVKYVYYDHYDKGEGYLEVVDPDRERLTVDEIPGDFSDVRLVAPWDEEISYSPTAVMRLETGGVFIQKSLPVMIIINILIDQLLALVIILAIKTIKTIIIFLRKKLLGKDPPVYEDVLELPEAGKRTAELPAHNA